MSEQKQATHIAIPVKIYSAFIEAIKSEQGLTPDSLAKLIISAEPINVTKNEPELIETISK